MRDQGPTLADPRGVREGEAPGGVDVDRIGVIDPHPRADQDLPAYISLQDLESPGLVERVMTPGGVQPQGGPHLARPRQEHRPRLPATTRLDGLKSADGLARPDQDRGALALSVGHQVEQVMNAVTEVDVCAPWRTPHGRIAIRATHAAVVGAVLRPSVGLDFSDAKGDLLAPQVATEEISGHLKRITRKEVG